MKKTKRTVAIILSIVTVFGMTVTSHAASSDVNIEIKETTMDQVSVTVPTALPIIFNEDGSNTLPTNWSIENRSSIAGIHLAQVDMDAEGNGWVLLAASEDTKKLPVDSKAMQFSLGKEGALKLVEPSNGRSNGSGSVAFAADEIVVESGETQVLSFDVKRGAFTKSEVSAKAFDMTMRFEFN